MPRDVKNDDTRAQHVAAAKALKKQATAGESPAGICLACLLKLKAFRQRGPKRHSSLYIAPEVKWHVFGSLNREQVVDHGAHRAVGLLCVA